MKRPIMPTTVSDHVPAERLFVALRAAQILADCAWRALEGHCCEAADPEGGTYTCPLCAHLETATAADYLLRQLAAHLEGHLLDVGRLDPDLLRALVALGGARAEEN